MTASTEAFTPLTSLMDTIRSESFESLETCEQTLPEVAVDPDPNKSNQNSTQLPEKVIEDIVAVESNDEDCKEPKVLIDRDADRITHIRVLCCCGHSIVIDCQYPDISEETVSEQPTTPLQSV